MSEEGIEQIGVKFWAGGHLFCNHCVADSVGACRRRLVAGSGSVGDIFCCDCFFRFTHVFCFGGQEACSQRG